MNEHRTNPRAESARLPGQGWVRCEDALPEDGAKVLVFTKRGTYGIATFLEGRGFRYDAGEDYWTYTGVTHWAPLSPPPPMDPDAEPLADVGEVLGVEE